MFCKLSSLEFTKLANSTPLLSSCRSVFTFKFSLDQARLFITSFFGSFFCWMDFPRFALRPFLRTQRALLFFEKSVAVMNSGISLYEITLRNCPMPTRKP